MVKPDIYPLNAPGDFYVENGMCIACEAPEHEAPSLMSHDSTNHCYFKKQPETPAEIECAVRAVAVSCCEAVRYGGNDEAILERLRRLGSLDGWNWKDEF